MVKWALELFEFDHVSAMTFHKSIGIGRFCDIICTISEEEPEEGDPVQEDPKNQWVMHVDGSSNANRLRVGLILTSPEGDVIQYVLHFGFPFMNNETKYEALIIGLKISKELGV